jgi:hypothetical protein
VGTQALVAEPCQRLVSHYAYRISAIIGGVLLVVAGGIAIVGAASERQTYALGNAPHFVALGNCCNYKYLKGWSEWQDSNLRPLRPEQGGLEKKSTKSMELDDI